MEPVLNNVKTVVSRGNSRQYWQTLRRRSSVLVKFLSVQVLVQAISLFVGIMLVRTMSQREYAFFTLANSMQSTLIMLADVGISSGLMAIGGKVWQDKERFGQLIQTGLQMRRMLGWISLSVVVPLIGWLFLKNGAGPVTTLFLGIVVLLGAYFRLTNDVLIVIPRLEGKIDRLQHLELASGVFRLITVVGACLTFVNATLAVLLNSLAFGIQGKALRKWADEGVDLHTETNAEDRVAIWRVIRQQAPNTVFYCIQGQLTVFLISIFGKTQNIAEIGALGRLSVLFTLVSAVMMSIVQPRFARAQRQSELKKIYMLTLLGYGTLSGCLLLLSWFLPELFLWVLGKSYQHLHSEFQIMIFAAVIAGGTGTIYGMNTARAWVRGAWLSIPTVLLSQLLLLFVLDISTVRGAVLLGALPLLPGTLPFLYRAYRELRDFKETM